jgi:inositol phosphorylceramide mannosyltransferase catalytic subunit
MARRAALIGAIMQGHIGRRCCSQQMSIPKIIHQTVRDKNDIHPVFLNNISELKDRNKEWLHRLYDDEDIRKFLIQNYGSRLLQYWERINPIYGPARADFFRYLLLYKTGGIYLDIKSTALRKLDEVIFPDDRYVLSHWNEQKYPRWGREIGALPEFQQWHIIASPNHPFLEAVIETVKRNIDRYDPEQYGVGKVGVMMTTGPVAYTLAIQPVRDRHPYRLVDIEDLGFRYSIVEEAGSRGARLAHERYFKQHYRSAAEPIIVPRAGVSANMKEPGRNELCPCGSGKKYKHCHGRAS